MLTCITRYRMALMAEVNGQVKITGDDVPSSNILSDSADQGKQ